MSETHWKKQFKYDHLGAYSLPEGKDVILTISAMKREKVVGANGKKEDCFICHFSEKADWVKPMILNKTNCKTIEKMCGTPFIEKWVGQRIQLTISKVDAWGELVDSLRVKNINPDKVVVKPTVETDSAVWNQIIKALKDGYKMESVTTRYNLSSDQIKALKAL